MRRRRITKALELRKKSKDPFRNINGYSWDYVMVFKVKSTEKDDIDTKYHSHPEHSFDEKKFSLKGLLNRFADAGLETKIFYSVQRDEIYCKIRASLERLRLEGDRVGITLLLDSMGLSNALQEGNLKATKVENQWAPVRIPTSNVETSISPYDYIYFKYDALHPKVAQLYKRRGEKNIFRGVDRLKLIAGIISGRIKDGGCHLDVYRLIKNKQILTFFPIHDLVELRELEDKWLRFCQFPWNQDVDCVKDYFGEKIGMYFLWLGHYTTWLIAAAAVGFVAWIVLASYNNDPNTPFMPYFAVFIGLWSTLYLAYWRRKEKLYAMRWGMHGFEVSEQDRAEFEGIDSKSPIDGSPKRYFSRREYFFRMSISAAIIFFFMSLVIASVVAVFTLRIALTTTYSKEFTIGDVQLGAIISSIANAVQIQVMNEIYGIVSVKLNDFENHRTETEYENALISKTFAFQFVNSFASLFYISFVKPFIPSIDACQINCLKELQITLGTIFLTRLATGSIVSIMVPWINKKLKEREELKGVSKKKAESISDLEHAYMATEYHVLLGTFNSYAEMVIQFGYATMFIAAFPLATVCSLINNYVEMRVSAWKLCQLCRRPEPRSCSDIGTWFCILEIISVAAVLVNAALIAFTSTLAMQQTWSVRIWIFLGTSVGTLLVKSLISLRVPETPLEVEIQLQRQEYITSKIFYNVKDEDSTSLVKNINVATELIIRITDDDPL